MTSVTCHIWQFSPDPSRKDEIVWPELVNQRMDVTDANERWLAEFKRMHDLP